jgi:excisionase family DNA binding protein
MDHEIRPVISPVGPIYTTEDTAIVMKVPVRTVQRLIRSGQLKSRKIGRIYRILGKDIEAFFAEPDQDPTDYSDPTKEPQFFGPMLN